MFNTIKLFLLATTVACQNHQTVPEPDVAAEQRAIQQLLNAFGAALNNSDAATITPLFAQDGVFGAPGNPTATGQTQIRGPSMACSGPSR